MMLQTQVSHPNVGGRIHLRYPQDLGGCPRHPGGLAEVAKDSQKIHGFLDQQMGPEGVANDTRHLLVDIWLTTRDHQIPTFGLNMLP